MDSKAITQLENLSILKCLPREILMSCPDWTKNAECDSVMTFAKGCSIYSGNMDGGGKGKKGKKAKKNDENTENGEKEEKNEENEGVKDENYDE